MQPVRWIDAPLRRVARPSAAADPIPPTTLVAASWALVSAASGGYVKRSSGFWGRMPPPLAPEAGG